MMMMQQQETGGMDQGGMGHGGMGMNPLMMLAFMNDDCKVDDSKFSTWAMAASQKKVLNDALKKQIAKGEVLYVGTTPTAIKDTELIAIASFTSKSEAHTKA